MNNTIVLVGAGGTGMSGLAMILYDMGYRHIVCINNVENDLTDRLVRHGLKVIIGHGHYTVDFHDIVIYSDIPEIVSGPELEQSRVHQDNTTHKYFHISMSYNQLVAEISKRFVTISVAGSNGKTSTTAMLIRALFSSGPGELSTNTGSLNADFGLGLVGGLMPNFDQQGYALSSDPQIQSDCKHLFDHIFYQKHQLDYSLLKKYIFVIEACEYKEHFLSYDSDYTLITNIDWDHTDYFHSFKAYQQAFVDMIHQTRHTVVVTPQVLDVLSGFNLVKERLVVAHDYPITNPYLIGSYSDTNAGLIQTLFSGTRKITDEVFSQFRGVGRRMEYLGTWGKKPVYSDYSHHAPALKGNIDALQKKFPDKKICVIFQPHQAQRVLAARDEFQEVLKGDDTTIIYRLYTAREDFDSLHSQFDRLHGLSNFDQLGKQFAGELGADYVTTITDLAARLDVLSDDYVIVYCSAGDLDREMRQTFPPTSKA